MKAIEDANIDYSAETLILIRGGDGSSSHRREFHVVKGPGGSIVAEMHIRASFFTNTDHQAFCLALVVPKAKASGVRLEPKIVRQRQFE